MERVALYRAFRKCYLVILFAWRYTYIYIYIHQPIDVCNYRRTRSLRRNRKGRNDPYLRQGYIRSRVPRTRYIYNQPLVVAVAAPHA